MSAGALRPVGDAGLLVTVADAAQAHRLAAHLRARALPGVVDVVPAHRSVLLVCDRTPRTGRSPGRAAVPDADPQAWADGGCLPGGVPVEVALAAAGEGGDDAPPRVVEVPTTFDGPDLEEVAAAAGLGVAQVVDALVGAELRVEVLGFSPGFAYLSGLPPPLAALGRRATPRPVVPAGSVALAGGFAAVYPQATPGGWHLVGRTALAVFDPDRAPFAALTPGDRVRFVVAEEAAPGDRPGTPGGRAGSPAPWRTGAPPPGGSRPGLVVEEPGLFTLVQDLGRRGVAHLGVPRAGAADPMAHALANRLVGNPDDAAALEITARGPALRALVDLHVVLVGEAATSIDGRAVPAGSVLPLGAGQRLVVGATTGALRAVLAVAGGIAAPRRMGSAATDTLSWTGAAPLRAGDVLATGPPAGPLRGHLRARSPGPPARRELRVLPGPHPEWFAADALGRLGDAEWVVDGASDRVGLRLRAAPGEGVGRRPGELVSEPMVVGAVQVPPSGDPVVLGPDHATLGGYPVVAVVIAADRSAIGRCRPGDRVALRPVDHHEARAAWRALQRTMAGAVVGSFPTASGA